MLTFFTHLGHPVEDVRRKYFAPCGMGLGDHRERNASCQELERNRARKHLESHQVQVQIDFEKSMWDQHLLLP